MKEKGLYGVWAGMFILCAGLGFIPSPTGGGRGLLILLALAFFVPGAVILYQAIARKDRKRIRRVRNLAIASLLATVILLLVNFLSIEASDAAGWVLHVILVIVSSPMVCGQNWLMSLFLWACLLMASISALKNLKK